MNYEQQRGYSRPACNKVAILVIQALDSTKSSNLTFEQISSEGDRKTHNDSCGRGHWRALQAERSGLGQCCQVCSTNVR